jgi:tetratricopeptide (TPR) repeat protein
VEVEEMSEQKNDDGFDIPPVEQLEEELAADPTNLEEQEALAKALLKRYLHKGRSEQNVERLKRLLAKMPKERVLFERAYIAWRDRNDNDAVEKLRTYAIQMSEARDEPLTSDELWNWVDPFMTDPPKGLWGQLAEVFAPRWPDSAVVLTLRGMGEDDPIIAVDYLVQALERDETFWVAAGWCGSVYAEQKNWRAARGYYLRALKSETAALVPDLHYSLAWCNGHMKEYGAEAQAWQACLEQDPDYPYARNNLGWSLMKARKYDEAVTVFREAIQRGNDGKYPLRNLARTLRRLGKFSEAIDVLRQDVHRGAVTKTAQKVIVELEGLIRKQAEGEQLPIDVTAVEMEDEDESVGAPAPIEEDEESIDAERDEPNETRTALELRSQSITSRRQSLRTSHSIQTEETLEALLEEMICREGQAFGRRLRIFESLEGVYGRQLAIAGIGRIDLLVGDVDTQELIVIELKRAKSTDEVVGQLCRYLGWVRENLAEGNQMVRGIICVRRSSEKLRLAVSAVSGVEIFEYTSTVVIWGVQR